MGAIASGPWTSAPLTSRRLWHVKSVGRTERQAPPAVEERLRLPTADLLAGLHGYGFCLSYLIQSAPNGINVSIGSWQAPNKTVAPINLDTHSEALRSSLAAVYPTIETEPATTTLVRPELSGLVIGIPNLGQPDRIEQTVPIDRLIRALHGTSWTVLILAEPVTENAVRTLRHETLNEQRTALTLEKSEGVPSPLTSHYSELLKASTDLLTQGLSLGVWRTAVYLMADTVSYFRLESVWRSIFAGEESLLAPLIANQSPEIAKLAVQWSMPDVEGLRGPGAFRHPYRYQTLLTSHQLATYIHFPEKETSGFAIHTIPSFDVVRTRPSGAGQITLGEITVRGHPTHTDYLITVDSLAEHAFISGVTGSGKTTTIFQLLKEADRLGKPFLVIEPAKTEYRELLNDKVLEPKLQVFTLGNENVSPFRLNPFEKSAKTPISVHLEMLRSVFAASFGMWQPLPQVLESSIHAVYRDRGWDLTQNSNARLDEMAPLALAFPTLTDLVDKVEEITPTLGYDQKIASDIRAALVTRINSLRVGGKGRMLDTQYSIPMEYVLDTPTILELEDMGDDDDKAFMMGLILIRVVEHLRDAGRSKTLTHLLVLEEAHRLLTNIAPSGNPEQASPRAKAIEAFSNMLAEVRAYGLGMIIADQIPTRLIPDVIKNTNLKIVQRIVAEDDRAVLAGAMTMNESQMRALSLLEPKKGEAVVFSQGDDAPIMVQIVDAKPKGDWPDAPAVIALRRKRDIARPTRIVMNPSSEYIETDSPSSEPARRVARTALESAEVRQLFAAMVTSIAEEPRMLAQLWKAAVGRLQQFRTKGVDDVWLQSWFAIEMSAWFARMRGTQSGWTYSEQQKVEDLLRTVFLAKAKGTNADRNTDEFRDYWRHLHERSYDPLPSCSLICKDEPHVCLYRIAVAESLSNAAREQFAASHAADSKVGASFPETWRHCVSTATKLVSPQPALQPATQRAALCYAQHQLLGNSDEVRERIMNRLIEAAKGTASNE